MRTARICGLIGSKSSAVSSQINPNGFTAGNQPANRPIRQREVRATSGKDTVSPFRHAQSNNSEAERSVPAPICAAPVRTKGLPSLSRPFDNTLSEGSMRSYLEKRSVRSKQRNANLYKGRLPSAIPSTVINVHSALRFSPLMNQSR
jgi:hypothetical protein